MNDISVFSLLAKLIDDEEQLKVLSMIFENYYGEDLLKKLLEIDEEWSMLNIDYELKRQEGAGHERKFHVDEGLKTINSNAVYIEAPNAKGKSTFLNIIAIAFYGDRLEETDSRISQSLRSDIEYINTRENQNYTFKVAITSKDGSIQLISTKDNPNSDDIEVKEIINGKEKYLPVSTFKDEYFLIYDIPEDPLNRITEILSGVKYQRHYPKI